MTFYKSSLWETSFPNLRHLDISGSVWCDTYVSRTPSLRKKLQVCQDLVSLVANNIQPSSRHATTSPVACDRTEAELVSNEAANHPSLLYITFDVATKTDACEHVVMAFDGKKAAPRPLHGTAWPPSPRALVQRTQTVA